MPRYQVRFGETLPHDGQELGAGQFVELSRAVAEDPAVRGLVQEVDAKGQPVTPVASTELDRFRTHERVTAIRTQLAAAQGVVDALKGQLAAEEQRLEDEVTAARAARDAAAAPAAPEAPAQAAAGKKTDKQPAKGQES